MNKQFYSDEKEVFKYFINDYFLNSKANYFFKEQLLTEYHICSPIEFIIRPECNQKCKYCYITQYGEELYPLNERKTNNEIIYNFSLLLKYLDDKKILLPKLELFAGDLFYDNLIYNLLEIIYNYYNKIYSIESFYFNSAFENNKLFQIIIPCNFSFVNNNNHVIKIKEWQNKFKKINVKIMLSASVDGKYATQVRENKSNDIIDEYYDKIFSAIFTLHAGCHPMISAENIENAIKNYDWWITTIQKYNKIFNYEQPYDFIPFFLEVRNDGVWTPEKINKYKELLQHMIKHRLELCNNSIELFTSHLFNKNETYLKIKNPDLLKFFIDLDTEESSCAFTKFLHINVQNMSIIPCHRLAYYHFIGGKFVIEKDNIIDIEPINPSGYMGLITMNFSFLPKCSNCPLNDICVKGCLGAQYESSGELLIPCQSVCDLLHAKYSTLIIAYNELGVFKEAKLKNYLSFKEILILKNICKYLNITLDLGD